MKVKFSFPAFLVMGALVFSTLAVAGCGKEKQAAGRETEDIPAETVEKTDSGGAKSSPPVHIGLQDEVPQKFDCLYEYNDDSGKKMVLWTDVPRKNFEFLSIGFDESLFAESIIYSSTDWPPEKALFIQMSVPEGIPNIGISFLDENNIKRYFYISESGADGSLSLVEFQPTAAAKSREDENNPLVLAQRAFELIMQLEGKDDHDPAVVKDLETLQETVENLPEAGRIIYSAKLERLYLGGQDSGFTIYGTWQYAEVDAGGNIHVYVHDDETGPDGNLHLTINNDDSIHAAAYETDIRGRVYRIDDYDYHFRVKTRAVMWRKETVDEIIYLTYNPDNKSLKYDDNGEAHFFVKKADDAQNFRMDGTTVTKYTGNETHVSIPPSVTVIGRGAFSSNKTLTSVEIPSSVTMIEDWAFGDCANLTGVIIPSSVTIIGAEAFGGCMSLTHATLSRSTRLDTGVFESNVQIRYRD